MVFITEIQNVYCAVQTRYLNKIHSKLSLWSARSCLSLYGTTQDGDTAKWPVPHSGHLYR